MLRDTLKPAVLIILVAIVLYAGYTLFREKQKMGREITNVSEAVKKLKEENEKLRSDIEYYKLSENLLKASKARFNYTKEGERMIIVVPSTSSTSASSTKK